MINEIISRKNINLQVDAADWREAMCAAGKLLVAGGYTTQAYTDEMITAVETLGPYIVVAPGIALAHSRPALSVLKTGISLATLAKPVNFGSEENDPVSIVFGLCATDSNSHIEIISQLVNFLDEENSAPFLQHCQSVEDVYQAINNVNQGA
ncbi:PTS sugar transporter subunit IIA [Scandinavium goeteborgense]|uniref:Ascorbate-specific PTS system EIIA component n=1 Tax=Scandinavium goeteborgense TaxID=1851514 RepID=A0A4R6DQY7_SCAGO|nr:PTS sugar transporter subunit IIA [Scandinavium goeteborgense]TDN47440.1 PTS system ascorbate-specific IIA component [Scandinavium goeteborgense]